MINQRGWFDLRRSTFEDEHWTFDKGYHPTRRSTNEVNTLNLKYSDNHWSSFIFTGQSLDINLYRYLEANHWSINYKDDRTSLIELGISQERPMLRDQQTAAMVKVMELSQVLHWCASAGVDSSLLHLYLHGHRIASTWSKDAGIKRLQVAGMLKQDLGNRSSQTIERECFKV